MQKENVEAATPSVSLAHSRTLSGKRNHSPPLSSSNQGNNTAELSKKAKRGNEDESKSEDNVNKSPIKSLFNTSDSKSDDSKFVYLLYVLRLKNIVLYCLLFDKDWMRIFHDLFLYFPIFTNFLFLPSSFL